MEQKLAKQISKKVQLDYNRIAKEFSNKRHHLTPDILEFKKYIKNGDKVLDFGCGNGRVSELVDQQGAKYTGVDNSLGLIEQAKNKYPKKNFIFCEDITFLNNNEFDTVIALAVFHHIPSQKMREDTLCELHRVLKPGGKLILTVWDLQDEKDKFESLEGGDDGDILYDFKDSTGKVLAHRYIHIFSTQELKELVSAKFDIVDCYQNQRGKKKINRNLVVVAQKVT